MVDLTPKWAKPLAEEGLAVAKAQLEELQKIRKLLEKVVAEMPPSPGG